MYMIDIFHCGSGQRLLNFQARMECEERRCNTMGCFGNSFGNDSCLWIIILIIILFCCCGNNDNNGCGCGC